jgi:hypothetical protein
MKKICWITGFNEGYYNEIAHSTLKSWEKLQGDKILLAEMPLTTALPYTAIDIRTASLHFPAEEISKIAIRGGKFFKFFRKSLSVWYGLTHLKEKYDYIIWLDSDVIVDREFDPMQYMPDDDQLYSTIFKANQLPDSGFAAFNTSHRDYDSFVQEYINYYFNGRIYQLANPWDNYILEDYARNKNIKNLWKGVTTTKVDATCGFTDTVLEDDLTHFWGKKNKGKIYEI